MAEWRSQEFSIKGAGGVLGEKSAAAGEKGVCRAEPLALGNF